MWDGLARDSGGAVDMDAEWAGLFAGKSDRRTALTLSLIPAQDTSGLAREDGVSGNISID